MKKNRILDVRLLGLLQLHFLCGQCCSLYSSALQMRIYHRYSPLGIHARESVFLFIVFPILTAMRCFQLCSCYLDSNNISFTCAEFSVWCRVVD